MQHTNYLNALNEIPLRIALLKIKVGDGVVDSLESRLFVVVENSSIPVQDGHALIHGRMTILTKAEVQNYDHPRNGEMARYSPRFPRDLYLVVHAMVGPVIPLTRVQK